jgi:hypothetical protein
MSRYVKGPARDSKARNTDPRYMPMGMTPGAALGVGAGMMALNAAVVLGVGYLGYKLVTKKK